LARELGHPVIIDNRAGAGGSIGMTEVARAAPDGLTLGLATVSTHGVKPVVCKKLPYDAVNDFVAVGEVASAPGVMLVHPSVPATNMAEFLRYA
jgi:tripartite-type tricarboxylate transporter receptor subunit TctC